MLVPTRHIQPITMVQRVRMLPVPGEILVRVGQAVEASDVVAAAQTAPKHMIINVARGLGVSAKNVRSLMLRDVGDEVAEGDALAEKTGFGKRVVRAPAAGRIRFVLDGQVLLQVKKEPYALRAGIPGMVTELLGDRGVVIQASGALVQGAWGNGRLGFGMMKVLADAPDQVVAADQIDVGLRGAVILVGHCGDPGVFSNGVDQQLRGIILGSMASGLIPTARKMPYPVLVIEGLQTGGMHKDTYKLLSTNDGREVAINAEMQSASRPDMFIPLPGSQSLDVSPEVDAIVAGKKVRITRAPHSGKVGTVASLLPAPIELPSGLRAQVARVTLGKDDNVDIPLINLEVLG